MEDIQHVSDTASWIAAYRARESERPDAVFRDPLARKLAGPRGFSMVETTPYTNAMAFAMVARTTGIDRLVQEAIQRSVDTVINLGAGLDTRPYRMELPPTLQWIEVDFSTTIEYKNEVLKNDIPVCKLRRIASDLSHDSERQTLLAHLGKETKKALIITEGVIAYLASKEAEKLSYDLYTVPTFQYWIMDYRQGELRNNAYIKKLNKEKLARTPLQFNEPYPLQFFGRHGWKVAQNIMMLDEAERIGRRMPLKFPWTLFNAIFPRKMKELGNKTYGYVMFTRS
jgi:methyltransferase (TIGR00027 family)